MDPHRIARLRAREPEAWRGFLVEYHDVFARALRTALREVGLLGRREDLGDLLTDAMTYFYQVFTDRFSDYRGEGAFRAWLFQTVRYFVLDRRRELGRAAVPGREEEVIEHLDRRAAGAWESGAEGDPEEAEFLRDCLLRLPGEFRSVVTLYHFAEEPVTLPALAERLGESPAAVKKRYQRALERLQRCVEDKKASRGLR
jgi:RNA polymerase sigma-70 factor (ECF subfamily)